MNYEIRDEGEMMRLGEELGMRIFDGKEKRRVIELVGDVGAGKTTLVRGVARGLGIKDEVTSPSFTIMKRYSFGEGRAMAHYDFYRLGEAGIMAEDIREQMMVPGTIVIVEWGESVGEALPKERMVLEILMNEDGTRTLRETHDEEQERRKPVEMYLDTSTEVVRLKLDGKEYSEKLGREMAEKLHRFIKEKLESEGRDWKDITEIEFMSGPGSFTGLRIGAAVVNALAAELGVKLKNHLGEEVKVVRPIYRSKGL